MSALPATALLLNGEAASIDDLRALALVNYGHFTSVQVRDRAVQGIGLHQLRLVAATRELFGAGLDFAEAMRTEYRIVSRIARGHDFYEGVRAVVIDKDQAPRWQPATLDDVKQADIDAYFAPLGADELKLEG